MGLLPVRETPLGAVASMASSTIEFHSPQESHRPVHLPWTAPQDWQTKRLAERAID